MSPAKHAFPQVNPHNRAPKQSLSCGTQGTASRSFSEDVDPSLEGLVVALSTSDEVVAQELPGIAGANLTPSPVQADCEDEVVKESAWNADSGMLTVPARTVAVFVQK